MEKYFKKKGRQAKGPFAKIPFAIMDSDAFQALKPASALVYLRLFRRYFGNNNGYLAFGCRDAANECNISKMTAQRALSN